LQRSLTVPATLRNTGQLEEILQQLHTLKEEMTLYTDIEITIRIEG
jgi:hypothetical protein